MIAQLTAPPTAKAKDYRPPAKRIMIVEDESIISLDIKNSLLRLGYEIAGVAASGDSAIRKIQDSQPDLILMDIHLKGEMTGIDVSRHVKANFHIPIVYLTANSDDSTFKAANQTDPYAYLLKPFTEKEIGIAIEIALRKHEKEQIVRSSEHWYAIAFQSLSEAVVATDRHGDVVFMNALAESITGWTFQEALDRPLTDILQFQRKIQQFDSVEIKGSVSSILNATLRGSNVVPMPHDALIRGKASQATPVKGRAVAIRDSTGQITGSLFTFEPATDKNADSEKERSRIAELTPLSLADAFSSADSGAQAGKKAISQKEIDCIKSFIESFINQRPTSTFSSTDLVASYGKDLKTLSSRTEGNVITGKLIRDNLTAIVNRDSSYWEVICHILIENSFFPVSQRTNGTCYFQHCTIPKDCQVYRTNAMELWEVWHGKPCPDTVAKDVAKDADKESKGTSPQHLKVSRENLVVLRRGSWYHIQAMALSGNIVKIKTAAGELFVSSTDWTVWGTQLWR